MLVTGMKMEAYPELRIETEDRQSTEYEVHHQKLVNGCTQNEFIPSQTHLKFTVVCRDRHAHSGNAFTDSY